VRVAVVSDDLTGAADSGVQLARAGYRTAVAFRGSPIPPTAGLDAVAVVTDSRALPENLAARRVVEAGRLVRDARIVFKKVDSTLRGPVAAELAATLEATGRKVAVVCPAFPHAGRTVRGGVLLVDDVPVHETAFRHDPITPVRESHLPTLLASVCPTVATLSTQDLRDDTGRLRSVLAGSGCVVVDATTDDDLEALVRAVPDPASVLWVGSAGLVRAHAAVHAGPRAAEPEEALDPASGVIVAVGSLSGVARRQLKILQREEYVTPVPLDATALRGDAFGDAVDRSISAARSALVGGGRCVTVYSTAISESTVEAKAAERVADALAEVVSGLSDEGLFDALVLTGGDTAVGVARRLGASGVRLQDEIEPGVPVGTMIGPRPYRVVTKAGGFGAPDTLVKAVQTLFDGLEVPG
jgi:uncharacterized protein YgbK (DUF1537 family)